MSRHYWTREEEEANRRGHEDKRYCRHSFDYAQYGDRPIDKAYRDGQEDERREMEVRQEEEHRQEEERLYARRQEVRRQQEDEEYYRQVEEEEQHRQQQELNQEEPTEKEK